MIRIEIENQERMVQVTDEVRGTLHVRTPATLQHNGVVIVVEGVINRHIPSSHLGVGEFLSTAIDPIQNLYEKRLIVKPGEFKKGHTQCYFSFYVKPLQGKLLYQTYRGCAPSFQLSAS